MRKFKSLLDAEELGEVYFGTFSERCGGTERLGNLLAAILQLKLRRLESDNDERRRIAARYRELLAGLPLKLPPDDPTPVHLQPDLTLAGYARGRPAGHRTDRRPGAPLASPSPAVL